VPHASKVPALLELSQIHKSFGANQVLRGIDLHVGRGEVRALLGENGAGKSTLVNIVGGAIPAGAFQGSVRLDGAEVTLGSPTNAEALGVYEVAQELAVVPEMSVVENLFLNRQPSRAGLVDQRSALQRAVELARGIGLPLEDIDLTAPIKLLQPAQQQMICILRALIGDLKLLILDEPTSRLSETETEHLFDRIKLLRSQGISILYISHRLAEVRRIADTVTVLRDGRVSLQLEAGAQFDERQIVEAMTGQELDEIYPDRDRRHGATPGGPVLEVRDLSVVRGAVGHVALAPTSFEVSAGEVLGVFGVVGSGTSALAQALCGASPDRVGGTVSVNGRPLRRKSTADAVKHGLGYISGDPTEGTFAAPERRGEPRAARPAPRRRQRRATDPAGAACPGRPAAGRTGRGPMSGPRPADRLAERRQPAEGRAGEMAAHAAQGAGHGGSHPRHRRQGAQGRLSLVGGNGPRRDGHRADLERPGRGPGSR
jgi:ABC-type sugar transport system ATPase subunit